MKHKARLAVIMICGLVFGIFTMSCLKESEKANLNLGEDGFACREEAPRCDEDLECDEGVCVATIHSKQEPECLSDTDCEDSYECKNEVCVAKEDKPELVCEPACTNDKYCKEGICENRCPDEMVFI